MTHTTYTDPSGFDWHTRSTPRDQLALARMAMKVDTLRRLVGLRSYRIPVAGKISNTDTLLGHDGFVGIKTGSMDASGGCFMFLTPSPGERSTRRPLWRRDGTARQRSDPGGIASCSASCRSGCVMLWSPSKAAATRSFAWLAGCRFRLCVSSAWKFLEILFGIGTILTRKLSEGLLKSNTWTRSIDASTPGWPRRRSPIRPPCRWTPTWPWPNATSG